jgi:hypothetical protein
MRRSRRKNNGLIARPNATAGTAIAASKMTARTLVMVPLDTQVSRRFVGPGCSLIMGCPVVAALGHRGHQD